IIESGNTAAEHERILREIESTDTNCIGPTLRSVYDGQEHGLFMEKLDARIRNHDREIEKMCNHHFQGFVDSITELLKVRGEAQKLKVRGKGGGTSDGQNSLNLKMGKCFTSPVKISDGFPSSQLIGSMEELKQCRVQQRNIATTIDKLALCLPVLEMYSRLQEQMRAKRYYPALRTLEQLEHTCLPRAGQYRFCSIMAENIPKLRTLIQDTAMTQLRDFLESIRKHSDKIGETAIKQVEGTQTHCCFKFTAATLLFHFLSLFHSFPRLNPTYYVPGAQDLVDFSPVYRCLHIYTVLVRKSSTHETLRFFVVEDHILHTTQGLVNRAYVEELWELALSKIVAALRTHSSYCDDPDLVLDLKNLIVLFADTLQGYGFPVSQLFDMLLEMREQYGEILLKRWNITFRQILDQDNFSPIPVSTEQEYRQYTSQFPLQDPELEKLSFPKKLPFSEFVPKAYCQLKEFIYACLKYSEDLHLSSTEIDDMIRKSTNLLLTRTLSNCLQYAIKKKNVGLAELVQVIINTTHLEQSCHFLEEFITNITNVPPETANATKLYGTATFKDARHAAEAEIYTSLNAKIDQFLQLADYDWMSAAQSSGGLTTSDYLVDLITFLRSTFSVFTNLPGKVAQTACMSACKHISTSLMQLLLDPEVRQISIGALHQLNVDLKECEIILSKSLFLFLNVLVQLLDLFTQWDWSTYLADYGKSTCKYLRVNPHTALALLEKMKETSRKNVVLAQFKKADRDRQKLIDAVIKQLRNLIAQHHA
uniref:Exocyst complex component n=1 Tax=Xiphophorus couchianus TaxID=32473 RepID=A0A3B5LFR3_9TELE